MTTQPERSITPAYRAANKISKDELKRLRKKFKGTLTDKQRSQLMAASLRRIVGRARRTIGAPGIDIYETPQYKSDEVVDEYRDEGPNYNPDGDNQRLASLVTAEHLQGTGYDLHAVRESIRSARSDIMHMESMFHSMAISIRENENAPRLVRLLGQIEGHLNKARNELTGLQP